MNESAQTTEFEQFRKAVIAKLGRAYGWRCAYASATENSPSCQVVRLEDIHQWGSRRVPTWAYEQIDKLEFPVHQEQGEWTPAERDFLRSAWKQECQQWVTDAPLASGQPIFPHAHADG